MSRAPRSTVILASVLLALAGRPIPAQQPLIDSEALPEPVNVSTRILSLKKADAQEVGLSVQELFGKGAISVVAHTPTNSILIQAAPRVLEQATAVIQKLDEEAATRPEAGLPSELKVFPLRSRKADEELRKLLASLLPKGAQVAVDPRQDLILVKGDPAAHQAAEGLLQVLDRPHDEKDAAPAPPRAKLVRLVWLVSEVKGPGGAEVELPPPPPDLAAVQEQAARVGVKQLRLAAQSLVQTLHGQSFQLTSQPSLGAAPTVLEVRGTLQERPGGSSEIQLSLSALGIGPHWRTDDAPLPTPRGPVPGGPGNPERTTLASLTTTVLARPKQPVVVCLAPVGAMTSVFVLEVSDS